MVKVTSSEGAKEDFIGSGKKDSLPEETQQNKQAQLKTNMRSKMRQLPDRGMLQQNGLALINFWQEASRSATGTSDPTKQARKAIAFFKMWPAETNRR